MNYVKAAGTYLLSSLDNTFVGDMMKVHGKFEHSEEEFVKFISKYGRQYATHDEYNMRFKVFSNNLDFIEGNDHEANGHVSINEFMDWTDDEFTSMNRAVVPNEGERNHPNV